MVAGAGGAVASIHAYCDTHRKTTDARHTTLSPFFGLLDQPDRDVVAVEDLSAVGGLGAGFLQAPPSAMQAGGCGRWGYGG